MVIYEYKTFGLAQKNRAYYNFIKMNNQDCMIFADFFVIMNFWNLAKAIFYSNPKIGKNWQNYIEYFS